MVVPIPLWLLSGHLGFLAQSKDMHKVRLLSDSKLAIGMSISDCRSQY